MNELGLFAGAGLGLLATASLGWKTVCAVELDWYCRCVLTQRQNDGSLGPFPIWDDIRTFDGRAWRGIIDVVSGGFPCQAYSTAAAGKNNADDLWPEMRRIVADAAPRYVFAENVSREAIDFAADDLEKMAYKTRCISLEARDMGGDHVRERFWLLAYSHDKGQLRRHINAKMAELPELREGVWKSGPGIYGVDDGDSYRVERFKAIGNGQVPCVAAAALFMLANSI